MAAIKLSEYKYAGRPCFELPTGRYYLISKHRTKGKAISKQKKLDFPQKTKVRKYNNWWLVLGIQTAR